MAKTQIGVALSEKMRTRIEAAACKSEVSFAEEVRRRLERTLQQDADGIPGPWFGFAH
jgi:hypothetical protein